MTIVATLDIGGLHVVRAFDRAYDELCRRDGRVQHLPRADQQCVGRTIFGSLRAQLLLIGDAT